MAYPAFVSSPWVYGVNYHAQELRQHSTPNRVRFGAASDADATGIATLFDGWTAAHRTTLTKRLGEHNVSVDHPTGTLLTCKATMVDSTGSAQTVKIRNLKADATIGEIQALLKGTASGRVTALGAAPTIIKSGNAVAVVNAQVIDRS